MHLLLYLGCVQGMCGDAESQPLFSSRHIQTLRQEQSEWQDFIAP